MDKVADIQHIVDMLNSSPSDIHLRTAAIIKDYKSAQNKSELAAEVASQLSYLIFSQGYSYNSTQPLVRIRKIANRDQVYLCPCQLGYPHKSTTPINRANFPNEPLLYVSTGLDCLIEELGGDKLKAFCEVEYSLQTECRFSFVPIGEIDHFRRHQRMLLGNDEARTRLEAILSALREEVRLAAQLADAFLADNFLLNPDGDKAEIYALTAALSKELLSSDKVDAILYPSAAHRGGYNFAIKPSVAREVLKPTKFRAYAVRNYLGYGIAEIEKYAEATTVNEKGEIQWAYSSLGNARVGIPPEERHALCPQWETA